MKGPAATLVRIGLRTTTSGLAAFGHPELAAEVSTPVLLPDVDETLLWIAAYVRDRKARIRPGEYMTWGYWQLRFLLRGRDLEIFEAEPGGRLFRPGISRTLTYLRDQKATCRRLRSVFSPPMMEAQALVSPSVLEGAFPLRLERVLEPPPSSGWKFVAGADPEDALTPVRLCHVGAARPEVNRYLAVVDGCRVILTEDGEVEAGFPEDESGAA